MGAGDLGFVLVEGSKIRNSMNGWDWHNVASSDPRVPFSDTEFLNVVEPVTVAVRGSQLVVIWDRIKENDEDYALAVGSLR